MTVAFPTAPTIETARLRLRAYRHDDFPAIARMVGDEDVMRFIGGQPQKREDAWRRMLCGPALWTLLGYGYWVVERRDDGDVIGQMGFADFKRDMKPSIEGLPEMGWMLMPHVHGQGYAGEAITAALTWADAHLDAGETVAIIDADNAPSIRVAERCGFLDSEAALYRGEPIRLFRRPKQAA